MRLEVRKIRHVMLVGVSGTMTMLDTPGQLKERVSGLLKEGERNFVLNLSRLTFVDSSFIGELVSCCITVSRAGGTVKLAGPGRRVEELLLITRLGQIFETFETDAAAVASFGG
jgi:anti-sigma B factor antagonist